MYEETLKLWKKSFLPDENVYTCVEINENPESIKEMERLFELTAQHGVSVVAIDTKTNAVVGAALSRIEVSVSKIMYLSIKSLYFSLN